MSAGEVAARRRAALPKRLTHGPLPDLPRAGEQIDGHAWIENWAPNPYPGQGPDTDAFIRAVVHDLLERCGPLGQTQLRRIARSLALLSGHGCSTGVGLNRKLLLDPATINQFTEQALKKARAAASHDSTANRKQAMHRAEQKVATYRSALRRVGEVLNPSAPWEATPIRTHRHQEVPYTAGEIALIEAQIGRMVPSRAKCGEALMVLGLGGGLDGRWAARVRTEDVVDMSGAGLAVLVPGRMVPVLACYDERLRALLAQCQPGDFLIGGKANHGDAANEAVARLSLDPKGPSLLLSRLRATWLVHHLTIGTRVPELMEAAGIETMTHLSDLAEFVPHLDQDPVVSVAKARAMVRGIAGEER